MDATQAREILTFSKSREGYEGPIPQDDDAAASQAAQLIAQAAIAWNRNNARGPEVLGVLMLADPDFDGTGEFALNGSQPPEPPQEAQTPPAPVQTPPEAPQAPQEATDDEYRTHQEPWAGYDADDMPTILAALDATAQGIAGYDEDDKPVMLNAEEIGEILGHVWAYESANVNRPEVLDKLAEIAERMSQQGQPEAPTPEPIEQDEMDRAEQIEAQRARAERDSPPPEKGIDYNDLIAEVEEELRRERIHLPEPPSEVAPEYPYDFSGVSDKTLRDLHGAFGAYAYYADSQVQRYERIATKLRHAADDIVRELLLKVAQYDEKGRERRMTFITAEVESTPAVVALRQAQRRHEIFAEAARRERDGYHKNVEGLSRQESMRHNEWLRAQR